MMINPLTGQRISEQKTVNKTKSVSATSFFDLLTDQLEPLTPPTTTEQTEAIANECLVPADLRLAGISTSENTIDLLESLGQALGNLQLTASDLLPLVEALEGDTTALLDIKEQLPQHDPLAQLIDRVTTISVIEAEKFRRGDYQ